MTQSKEEFLKVFKFELSNLVEDISALIEYEKDLHEENKHTNFVYLENLVVLKDEIMGINGISGYLDTAIVEIPENNFLKILEEKIAEFIKARGYPLAVLNLVKRKIEKIEEMKKLF